MFTKTVYFTKDLNTWYSSPATDVCLPQSLLFLCPRQLSPCVLSHVTFLRALSLYRSRCSPPSYITLHSLHIFFTFFYSQMFYPYHPSRWLSSPCVSQTQVYCLKSQKRLSDKTSNSAQERSCKRGPKKGREVELAHLEEHTCESMRTWVQFPPPM